MRVEYGDDGRFSSVPCSEITGLDCEFVAAPDPQGHLTRGLAATQVVAALSMHIARTHSGHALRQDKRDEIRNRLI